MSTRAAALIVSSVIAAAAASTVVVGQTPAPASPPATAMIIGQVVDATSGRPVAEGVVTLSGAGAIPVGPPARGAPAPRRVITDSQGRFFYRDLAKGSYTINVTKPGYVTGLFGKLVPRGPGSAIDLADGARQTDIRILVWKQAAIVGRVVDEAGEPVVGAPARESLESVRWPAGSA